jgi:hypothetical protein
MYIVLNEVSHLGQEAVPKLGFLQHQMDSRVEAENEKDYKNQGKRAVL